MSKENFEKTKETMEEKKEIEERVIRDCLIDLFFAGKGRDAETVTKTKHYIDRILKDETLFKSLRLDIMQEILQSPTHNNMWSRLPGGGERSLPDDILDEKYPEYSCTKRELFKMIDNELTEQKISKNEVENLWNQFIKIGKEKDYFSTEAREISKKIIEICHKIYPRLRMKGLTSKDIAY